MKKLASLVLAAWLALLWLPQQVLAEDAAANAAKHFVLVLGTAEMPVAGAGLHLALSARQSQRQVTILLLADGVDLALREGSGPVFAAYGADGPSMLRQALAGGAAVAICQICLKNRGVGLEAMAEGVTTLNAFEVLDLLETADAMLSFGGGAGTMAGTVESEMAVVPEAAAAAEAPCDPATDIDGCM